jgi:type I restriction enzyme S subunit
VSHPGELDMWEQHTLGEVIVGKPQYGLTAQSSPRKKGTLYLRISDITDEGELKTGDLHFIETSSVLVEKYGLHDDDFLIARSGSVGRVYLHRDLGVPSVFASYLIRFRLDRNKVLPGFVYYWGLSPAFKREIEARRKKVAQPNINAQDFCRFAIPVPPLQVQGNIVSILEKAHVLKRKRDQASQLTRRITQSVFLKMFGDPIVNPKHWETDVLERHSTWITKGATPTTYGFRWEDSGVLFLRSECITHKGVRLKGSQRISEKAHAFMVRSQVLPGDILIRITGEVGIACIYPEGLGPANINQHIARIRLKDNTFNPTYLLCALNTESFSRYYGGITRGVTHPHLSLEQIRMTLLPIPPIELQREFAGFVSRLYRVSTTQETGTKEVTNLFNSLMHRAFSGELTIRDNTLKVLGPHDAAGSESKTLDDFSGS